jgi:hypothetical protein
VSAVDTEDEALLTDEQVAAAFVAVVGEVRGLST